MSPETLKISPHHMGNHMRIDSWMSTITTNPLPLFVPPLVKSEIASDRRFEAIAEKIFQKHCDALSDGLVPCYDAPLVSPRHCSAAAALTKRVIVKIGGNDVNIVKIHEEVRKSIGDRISAAEWYISTGYASDIAAAKEKQSRETTPLVVYRSQVVKADERLENAVKDTIGSDIWGDYVREAKPLIERYRKVAGDIAKRVFYMREQDMPHEDPDRVRERVWLISRYIKTIAGKHMEIECQGGSSYNKQHTACPACGTPAADYKEHTHGTMVCYVCAAETVGSSSSTTFGDSVRIDNGSRQSYEDLLNFVKRIDAFEGKQKNPPPEELYSTIKTWLWDAKAIDNDHIKTLACVDERGRKPGTSIDILGEALSATGNSVYYRDIDLIANKIWGWPLPDVTSTGIRKSMIEDYVRTQKVYNEIKRRESSLNVNNRLFFHLKAAGYDCNIRDFKRISSKMSNIYHWDMFKVMAERCGLPFDEAWWDNN